MATTNDLKRGMRIELDGDPWTVLETTTQTPSARGSATLVKLKVRNIRTRQVLDKSFKAGEVVKIPDFELRPSQYLYDDGTGLHYFMDDESYEQFPLSAEEIETELGFLRPNDPVRALFFDGKCIGIEVPNTVVLEVAECDPGIRGDTVNNVTKPAKLETGLEVQVPLFVETGDKLVVDTRDARYVRRA
jgi:elongation factor P